MNLARVLDNLFYFSPSEHAQAHALALVTLLISTSKFKKEAYRDGIKRKGDKIWMGYMKHG